VRFREDSPQELARARAAVAVWYDQNPAGTAEQLVAALGGQLHRDYGPVLRSAYCGAALVQVFRVLDGKWLQFVLVVHELSPVELGPPAEDPDLVFQISQVPD